jgi:hypothetical protein
MSGRNKRAGDQQKGRSGKGRRNALKEQEESDDEDSCEDREEDKKTKQVTKRISSGRTGRLPASPKDSPEHTDVSSLHPGESVTNTVDQERWRFIEQRMKSMEDRVRGGDEGGVSVVSGATLTPPVNGRMLKENLRKFVAAKVFPNWKFIFKKEKLGDCVLSAISKGYITTPPGFEPSQLEQLYGPTVRGCLDGCRANAQTTARKRYLSKSNDGGTQQQ